MEFMAFKAFAYSFWIDFHLDGTSYRSLIALLPGYLVIYFSKERGSADEKSREPNHVRFHHFLSDGSLSRQMLSTSYLLGSS